MIDTSLPVLSEVSFLDLFSINGNPQWWNLIRGVIVGVSSRTDGARYIIDPARSGHYGHKRYNIKAEDINPTPERIAEAAKIARIKCPRGFNAPSVALPVNSQLPHVDSADE